MLAGATGEGGLMPVSILIHCLERAGMDRFRRVACVGVFAASFALMGASSVLASPPVFKDLAFAAAKAEAEQGKKILIFDAMTSWCGPCKMMDKTAWVDPNVEAWIKANAVAIQVDMDQHKDLGTQLRVNAYPTIIVFKDGKEFDRIVGSRSGPDLLTWLEGVKKGESKLDQVLRVVKEERAKTAAGKKGMEFGQRAALAEQLSEYGAYEEALAECVWLWETMPSESRVERFGAVSSIMGNLVRRHAPAKAKFTAFRDEIAPRATKEGASGADLTEWLTLNQVIGDSASTVAWAVGMEDNEKNVAALQSVGPSVFGLLVESGHWAVAGKALRDPVLEIDQRGSGIAAYDIAVQAKTKPGSLPMMPLMRKGSDEPGAPAAGEGKITPAIPLMRKGDAAPEAEVKTVPAIPLSRKGDAGADKEVKSIPAIPLARKGDDGAKKDEQPKVVPAMPLMRKGADAPPATEGELPRVPEFNAPGVFSRDDEASIAREVRYRLTLEFQDMAATYYAACLAAGREAEAARIAEITFNHTDSPASRLTMARMALKAGQTRPEHVKWMDSITDAAKVAEALRSRMLGVAGK